MTAVQSSVIVRDLAISLTGHDWAFPQAEADRIEAHWQALRRTKPALYDGAVLLARGLAVEGDRLVGSAFTVGYKSFLCWRDFGYPGERVHNLFAMPALRSSDGAFLVGRMSAGTANAGRLYFPAGTPEPSDAGADGVVDFNSNILRELEEETGIAGHEVRLDATWTVLFAGPLVACMKVARAPFTAAELIGRVARFVAGQSAPELDGLLAVAGADDLDPVSMPAFMTHYLRDALDPRDARGLGTR